MSDRKANQSTAENEKSVREPYETPAIIYEGLITTRAGSPNRSPSDGSESVDPSEIFGDR